jgi:outer membrane protein, heavy metal efflux system
MNRRIRKTMNVFHYARRLMAVVTPAIFLCAFVAPAIAQQATSPVAPVEQRQTSVGTAALSMPPKQQHEMQHPQNKADGVSLASLIEAALAANPELAAMRREFDAARARIPQAQALPDPMVMLSTNTVKNPIPFTGLRDDFGELMLGFSQDLPWFGVRRLRGQVASAESEAKFQEYATTVLRLTSEVKAAYYDLYYTDRALAVLARDKDILDKIAQVAEARYGVGKAQQVDVINVRVEITELLDKQGMLEQKRAITTAQLNNLLYRDPETSIGTLAEVTMSAEPPPLEELARLASENAPDLKQLRRTIDANNKSLRLAEREAKYPEVGVNFTYHNRPFFADYYTYGVTLRLPLYAATKQRYAVKEQAANLAATQSRLDANLSLIRFKLRDARVRVSTSARLIRLHEQGLIPQATLALESALAAYQTGQVEMLTLLNSLKRALDYETRYYELLADYQKALAEMERYTGVELTK